MDWILKASYTDRTSLGKYVVIVVCNTSDGNTLLVVLARVYSLPYFMGEFPQFWENIMEFETLFTGKVA